MPARSISERVEQLEGRVDRLEQLPDRIGALEVQIRQLRDKLSEEIQSLRTHMQVLHEDLVARISLIGEARSRASRRKR